jgi:hypothetical protein
VGFGERITRARHARILATDGAQMHTDTEEPQMTQINLDHSNAFF